MKRIETEKKRVEFRDVGIKPSDVCSVSVGVDQLKGFKKYLIVETYKRK